MTAVYTRHPDLRLTALDNEGVVLHLGSRRYFSVNETGVLILEALEQPRTMEELVVRVTDEYEVTNELAESTAREFLDRCVDAELVRVEGQLDAALPFGWRVRALVAAAVIPPVLEAVSFARIERILMRAARWHIRRAPDDQLAAAWVRDVLSRLPPPWSGTCLRQSAVLYFLLRSAGRDVELCIGVRRGDDGKLRAHAWLARDGVPYLESDRGTEHAGQFNVIARFPSSASSA